MSDARLLLLPSFFLLPPFSSPGLICQLLIAVVLAGSHLPWQLLIARRTSTGESLSAVGLAGPLPARVGALWASPDLNRQDSQQRGPRRTSTARCCAPWASPGPQPARCCAPLWASPGPQPDLNRTSTATNKAI